MKHGLEQVTRLNTGIYLLGNEPYTYSHLFCETKYIISLACSDHTKCCDATKSAHGGSQSAAPARQLELELLKLELTG